MTVRVEKSSHIPDAVLEAIAYLHGAIDPDSGHLVCHHYPLGITLIEVRGTKAPALTVGECIYLVPPPWSRELSLASEPATIHEIGGDYTIIGKARVDTASLSLVLSLFKEDKASATMSSISIDVPGRGRVEAALIALSASWGEWAVLIVPCKGYEQKEGDLYV